MRAWHEKQQQDLQRTAQMFGKIAQPVPESVPKLRGPLNIVNMNHIRHT
jgi:hypothetical protein